MIFLSLPLVLLFLTVASTSSTPGLLHIPITRIWSGSHDIKSYSVISTRLLEKYANHRGDHPNAGVINERDFSFYGRIGIGTPPQMLNVALDTGSSDFWVVSNACTLACVPAASHPFYPSRSESFKTAGRRETLYYGYGEVSGRIATDVVRVAMDGFTIESQKFLSIDRIIEARQSGLLDTPAIGVIGLAFDGISRMGATPKFLHALISSGQLAEPEISFWISCSQYDSENKAHGGRLSLGGRDSTLFQGAIDFLNVVTSPQQPNTFWMLEMTSVTVQKKRVHITSGPSALASIDTGAVLIAGPREDVHAIWRAVPGSKPVTDMPGFWAFPCKKHVYISLSFGGKLWPIDPADINLGRLNSVGPLCVGAIYDLSLGRPLVTEPGEPRWIIGEIFLRNVYSVFRVTPPSIGFAKLSVAAGGSEEMGKGRSRACAIM
ncbi:aspartic peptidase domain-containing protein [Infundibulicybe gibba]|nr:aspartic peptidase domain-containing protein [Infundibulicybe gibba]